MIYALDLSIALTGVAIYNDKKEVVFIGSIATYPKDTHGVRLNMIKEYISELMVDFPPSKIVIERGFTRFNKATQVLYMVHGVVLELFKDYDVIYYPPKTIKHAITGKGNASKLEVRESVQQYFPDIDIKNYDESDALAIGLTYFELEVE